MSFRLLVTHIPFTVPFVPTYALCNLKQFEILLQHAPNNNPGSNSSMRTPSPFPPNVQYLLVVLLSGFCNSNGLVPESIYGNSASENSRNKLNAELSRCDVDKTRPPWRFGKYIDELTPMHNNFGI
ncbi:unnamed protein product [Hymenolepis diminuta]|uniref:Uncharacterized protein n=1 Tax=Hymenolepis diminuta TaxID=6216 RepID=A0A564YC98_HYMDI|nr:unnamed protein product [Hymenolepis diminuta]